MVFFFKRKQFRMMMIFPNVGINLKYAHYNLVELFPLDHEPLFTIIVSQHIIVNF